MLVNASKCISKKDLQKVRTDILYVMKHVLDYVNTNKQNEIPELLLKDDMVKKISYIIDILYNIDDDCIVNNTLNNIDCDFSHEITEKRLNLAHNFLTKYNDSLIKIFNKYTNLQNKIIGKCSVKKAIKINNIVYKVINTMSSSISTIKSESEAIPKIIPKGIAKINIQTKPNTVKAETEESKPSITSNKSKSIFSYKIFGIPLVLVILIAVIIVIVIFISVGFKGKGKESTDTTPISTQALTTTTSEGMEQAGGYRSLWKHMI